MSTILLTGFEPFGGDRVNASGEVARLLGQTREDVEWRLLPVSFADAPRELLSSGSALRPGRVVCLGEAGGRRALTPERRARNVATARIPDNTGVQPRGEPLDHGPEELVTAVDVDALVAAARAVEVAAEVSEDAGEFVCNAVFRAALREFGPSALFIHMPAIRVDGAAAVGAETDAQAPVDSGMFLADAVRGVSAMLDVLVAQWDCHSATSPRPF